MSQPVRNARISHVSSRAQWSTSPLVSYNEASQHVFFLVVSIFPFFFYHPLVHTLTHAFHIPTNSAHWSWQKHYWNGEQNNRGRHGNNKRRKLSSLGPTFKWRFSETNSQFVNAAPEDESSTRIDNWKFSGGMLLQLKKKTIEVIGNEFFFQIFHFFCWEKCGSVFLIFLYKTRLFLYFIWFYLFKILYFFFYFFFV